MMRRCLNCKWWHPVTEIMGKCYEPKRLRQVGHPIAKLANQSCEEWEPYRNVKGKIG